MTAPGPIAADLAAATLAVAWRDDAQGGRDERTGLTSAAFGPGRLEVEDAASDGLRRLRLRVDPGRPVTWTAATLELPLDLAAVGSVLTQGFQSWTETVERPLDARISRLSAVLRPFAGPCGADAIFPGSGRPGRLHGFAYTWLRGRDGQVTLIGSLAEHEAHTVLEVDAPAGVLRVHRDVLGWASGGPTALFDLAIVGPAPGRRAVDRYQDALGLPAAGGARAVAGWTSWYYHYTRISEALILDQLEGWCAAGVPLEVFQIDDGYQREVGDWLETGDGFPNGMKPVADAIRARGLRPGLWLAPFVCVPASRTFREHPEWLARDPQGRLVKAGYNPLWRATAYALDVTHPGLREHLRGALRTIVEEWGFELLKVDFLYAAGLAPQGGLARGAVMASGLDLLREAAGSAQLLGCGVPFGQALGRFDICRVGSDVAESWETRALAWFGVAERLSTVNALRSTLGRALLGGRPFRHDPDVFLLRRERCRLTPDQQRTLLLVNLVCGQILFTSDDVRRYDERARHLLRAAFPLPDAEVDDVTQRGDAYTVRARAWGRPFLALVNLGARPARFDVAAPHFDPEAGAVRPAGPRELRPFASVCLAPLEPWTAPCVVGGDGHLLPGGAVAAVALEDGELTVERRPLATNAGTVWVGVPQGTEAVRWGESTLTPEPTPLGPVVAAPLLAGAWPGEDR